MGYGVDKWQQHGTRARTVGKRRKRSTSRARKSRRISAPRARKRKTSRRSSKRKASLRTRAPRARKPRRVKAKKARTYTRYDPVTGRKYKVTEDDPRYDDWPSRKPSKRSKLAHKIRERPAEYAAERATRVIERKVSTATSRIGKSAATAVATRALPVVGAAAASAAILAAGYVVMDRYARSAQLAHGEKVNKISLEFVDTQHAIMRAFSAGTWSQVPENVRNEAVKKYTSALRTADAQAQGSAFVGQRAIGSYK